MNEENLSVFVDYVTNYFTTVSKEEAQVGTPYLIKDINSNLSDYTGIIGISGNFKGSVFFTAPKVMLVHLLTELGLLSSQDHKVMDLVGEISNTIAGNARREFGEQFMLSVPIVLKGKSDDIGVMQTANIYMIPIVWRRFKANLIIKLGE